MDKEENKVVEETTQPVEKAPEQKIDESKFNSAGDPSVIKVDLLANKEEIKEPAKVVEVPEAPDENKVVEVEAVEQAKEIIEQAPEPTSNIDLPENVSNLLKFMNETGGDINDYVKLNVNVEEMDNMTALQEYYKKTKPHLNNEEIDFLMEDQFSYDEEVDEEAEVKRKKLALKEQVANAKTYLDGEKSKYYNEIKAGSKLTPEAQKAMDFFNRYNKESKEQEAEQERKAKHFQQKTDSVFNDKFEGFEYKVGDKKFRFNVNDVDKVKSTQGDINNFIGKFLDENDQMSDAEGYHKSLFTAMNSDAIANHFYEQGKADALKASIANSKNVDMKPRQSHPEVEVGGTKYRVLQGEGSRDFKVKLKRK
jgi:hypothetical protein